MAKFTKIILTFLLTLSLFFSFNNSQVSADSFQQNPEQLEFKDLQELKNLQKSEALKQLDPLETSKLSEQEKEEYLIELSAVYTPAAGDIFYTSSTQCNNNSDICKGITGHVGIVSPSKLNVIHIQAPGHKPILISINSWLAKYPSTTVIRHNEPTVASNAATWANNYYINGAGASKNYKVTIDNNLATTLNLSTTYCSLIVWQAYYFGGGKHFSMGIPVVPHLFVSYAGQHNMRTVASY